MTAEHATITRDQTTKTATLTVAAEGEWSLFAHDTNAASRPVAFGTGPATMPLPDVPGWACFTLRAGGHTVPLAERHLPMAGGYNFRDLGGFRGAGGKRVAWGKFFRTDGMGHLTDADLAYLATIPVKTVVDFRTAEEGAHSPDRIPPSVATVVHLPIAPGYMNPAETRNLEDYESADAFMLHMYRDLAQDAEIAASYREFFSRVQAADDVPLIFHCSAGKDRTGIAAAFILTALGVDRSTVFNDYEVSNAYLHGKYAHLEEAKPYLKGLFTVKKAFLDEAFSLIEADHGSITAYLENVLDVDIALMRDRYLV